MAQRVKWKSTIRTSDRKEYQRETPKIVKKDVIERGVEARKARYVVVDGVPHIVQSKIDGKPSVIKETIIQEESRYEEQSPELFEQVEFDALVSELQDYGKVKYYRCEHGKLRIPEDAVYYESEE
jgi:hypothetical protein